MNEDDDVLCPQCGEPCTVVYDDYGFGYEYGSEVGYHENIVKYSECCGVYL